MIETVKRLKTEDKKAVIPFLTAGDPDLETTERLVLALEGAGADLVMIGVPFSDPVAECPAVQAASVRAIEGGVKLVSVFALCEELRKKVGLPIILKTYTNTVFGFGTERFFARAKECGVDAILVPDLPYEERGEFSEASRASGVVNLSLIAPTSRQRVKMIAQAAEGFLYCLCPPAGMAEGFFGAIREDSGLPLFAETDELSGEALGMIAACCDGVILGSAVPVLTGKEGREAPEKAALLVKEVRRAIQ